MPKKKKATTKPAGGKSKKKFNAAPILRVVLLLVIVGLIVWFWPAISSWAVSTWATVTTWVVHIWEGLLGLFGIGLALTAAFAAVVIWIFASGRFRLFTRYWQWWLGGIALAFAVSSIAIRIGDNDVDTIAVRAKIAHKIMSGSAPPT
jgi:hypothetical protein